jgi:sigma-B regulation protein RsbU (phosphoserine phosphatase)
MNKIINFESLINFSSSLSSVEDIYSTLNITLLSLMGKIGMLRGAVYVNTDQFGFELLINKSPVVLPLIYKFSASEMRKLNPEIENELTELGFEYILPVLDSDGIDSVFLLGRKIISDKVSRDEIKYAQLTLSICSTSLDIMKNKRRLEEERNTTEKKNQLLSTLFELSKDFSVLLTKSEIIKRLSFYLMGQLAVHRFSIIEYRSEQFNVLANSFANQLTPASIESLKSIAETTVIDSNCEIEYAEEFANVGIKIISPITISGKILGFCLTGSKMSKAKFTEDDIHYVESLCFAAGYALENERLFKAELVKQQMEAEMSTALEIQKQLLPIGSLSFANFDIFGKSIPSRHVSGDYYDLIPLDKHRKLVVVADVSGKGIPAGLIMANFQAALRVLAELNLPLISLAAKLNKLILQNTTYDRYITAFFGILDSQSNQLEYLNAGHNPPILIKANGDTIFLNNTAPSIGMFEEYPCDANGLIKLSANDVIVIYTDGINEAKNSESIDYGLDNINNFAFSADSKTAQEICTDILGDVVLHASDTPQYDDITLVVIKIKI